MNETANTSAVSSRHSPYSAPPVRLSHGDIPAPVVTGSSPRDRWWNTGVALFLAVLTWTVFGQTVRHAFINFDDPSYVYDNSQVTGGLTWQGVKWAFTHVHSFNWHPLTWISHMLDCQLYGVRPAGHHLTNVLLHIVAAILLFLVLRSMTGYLSRSAFVAAVFAIHPLRVESVAWVSERKDVLSGVFFMLTIAAYVYYARRPWSLVRYGTVALFLVLGLLCKPMLVTLPVVLLLLDHWPLGLLTVAEGERRRLDPRRLLDKLPLLGLAAASCTATVLAQTDAIQSLDQIPLASRLANAATSYVTYMVQMVWPANLAIPYPFPSGGAPIGRAVAALALLAAVSWTGFALRRRYPYLGIGWLWYLIVLMPVIGVLQVGVQAHADRYTYLPQIGLYIAVAWAAADLVGSRRRGAMLLAAVAAIMLAALFFCARAQTAQWRDNETLWTHALACTTNNDVAHCNLGDALAEQGRLDEAIAHFRRAVEIEPSYANAHNNLGNALLRKGSLDEAIVHFKKAAAIQPGFAVTHYNLGNALFRKGEVDEAIAAFEKALQLAPQFAEAHNNLGAALLRKGRADEAIACFQSALRYNPDYANAHNTLCAALLQTGRLDEAIAHVRALGAVRADLAMSYANLGNVLLEKGRADEAILYLGQALVGDPNNPLSHTNLGNALLQKGRADEALVHFRRALELRPDDADIQNNLAWMLATSPQAKIRDGKTALELAQRANRITGGENPNVLDTLGAAYAADGQFGEAISTARRAIDLAQARGQEALVGQLNAKLQLYLSNQPFREDAK